MAAATKSRLTATRGTDRIPFAVAAAALVFQGCMAGIDANGALVDGTTAAVRIVGVPCSDGSGAAGDLVEVQRGPEQAFAFGNSAAGDLITKADIGNDCYLVDNQTVAKTSNSNNRPRAGRILDVDAHGVWVVFVS